MGDPCTHSRHARLQTLGCGCLSSSRLPYVCAFELLDSAARAALEARGARLLRAQPVCRDRDLTCFARDGFRNWLESPADESSSRSGRLWQRDKLRLPLWVFIQVPKDGAARIPDTRDLGFRKGLNRQVLQPAMEGVEV